jgi:hypothetical protein
MDSLKHEVEAFRDLHVALLEHVRENAKTEALRALLVRCGVLSQSEQGVAHNNVVSVALAEAEAIADDAALLWLLERLRLPEQ